MQEACSHTNPAKFKLERLARGAKGKRGIAFRMAAKREPDRIETWKHEGDEFTLPRGALAKLREVLQRHELPWTVVDCRTKGSGPRYTRQLVHKPNPSAPDGGDLRWYQEEAIEAAVARQNCLLRAPTGSGKTTTAIGIIARLRLPTLIVVWTSGLLEQWRQRIAAELGIPESEIGIIGGGKRIVRPITLAMQQSLVKGNAAALRGVFGVVICDEVQRFGAATFLGVVDEFDSHYRIGISADECIAEGTAITMADGSACAIEDVCPGDEVLTPIGPRIVLAVEDKGHAKTGVVRTANGEVRCTENTWIASDRGWVVAKSSERAYTLNHEQRTRLQGLRETGADSLPGGISHGVRTSAREAEIELVQRSYGGNVVDYCGALKEDGRFSARCPETARKDDDQSDTNTRSAGEDDSDSARAVRVGYEGAIWGEALGEWETAASCGNARVVDACGYGILSECDRTDGERAAKSLQDRCGESEPKDRGGDRRRESQWRESEDGGCSEGFTTCGVGVAGSPIWVDVRSLVAAERCCELASAVVEWDNRVEHVYDLEIDGAACFFANNVLVHNTRSDGKEFLVYDEFGAVAHEVSREQLIDSGAVLDVDCRVIPTEFRADWYVDERERGGSPSHVQLFDEMTKDAARTKLAVDVAVEEVAAGEQVVVLTHRVEHAKQIAADLQARGVEAVAVVGGDKDSFEDAIARLKAGTLRAVAATVQIMGTGIDIPSLSRGVLATPIGANKQLYGQIRGRLCRTGKQDAVLYVLWDRYVHGTASLKRYAAWNRTAMVRMDDEWVDAKGYLKGNYNATSD